MTGSRGSPFGLVPAEAIDFTPQNVAPEWPDGELVRLQLGGSCQLYPQPGQAQRKLLTVKQCDFGDLHDRLATKFSLKYQLVSSRDGKVVQTRKCLRTLLPELRSEVVADSRQTGLFASPSPTNS